VCRKECAICRPPHERILPRVSWTVHHGGAGTTNSALRAGVLRILTPVCFDQLGRAYLVNKFGVGVGFSTQLQQISAEELGIVIKKLVADSEENARAKDLSIVLRNEDRAAAVV